MCWIVKSSDKAHRILKGEWRLFSGIIGSETANTGNRYILVMTDHFTKWVEAFAIRVADAPTCAKLFVEEWIGQRGTPEKLLTDNGSIFVDELMSEFCKYAGIKKINTRHTDQVQTD